MLSSYFQKNNQISEEKPLLFNGRLATHSANLFHRGSFHSPINIQLQLPIPTKFICSATVDIKKRQWLEPLSTIVNPKGAPPKMNNEKVKQIPLHYPNHHSVSVSPMVAIGLYDEVKKRNALLKEQSLGRDLRDVHLKFNSKYFNAYNEIVKETGGHFTSFNFSEDLLDSLSENKRPIEVQPLLENEVCISLTVQDAILSSNMIADGLPSMLALGGFLEFLNEAAANQNMRYAIGIQSIENDTNVHIAQKATQFGTLRLNKIPSDRRQGLLQIYLVVQCKSGQDANQVKQWLSSNDFRIASGKLVDRYFVDTIPTDCAWLYEADPMTVNQDFYDRGLGVYYQHKSIDSLDYALALYRFNEHQERFYTLNSTGLVLLDEPYQSDFSRANNQLHAWAEIVFSLVYLEASFKREKAFWSRKFYLDGKFIVWSTE